MIAVGTFRNNLLLIVFWLYLLLNYGVMQIRGPLGIPLGEMVLILALCTINYKVLLPRFLNHWYAIPFLLWWAFGLGHALWNFLQYGTWAIRDASHIIESLFVVVGFTFAGNPAFLEKFRRLLPWMFASVILYSLTFLVRDILMPLSPVLSGAQGQGVNVLFNYTNTPIVLIAAGAYYLQEYFSTRKNHFLFFSVLTLTLVLLLFPSRTLFFELAFFSAFWIRKVSWREYRKIAVILVLPVILLAGVFATGIQINGRYGTDFQLQDYLTVITEIFQGNPTGEALTSGNDLRIFWWTDILHTWSRSWLSMTFGLGYGMPLVSFVNSLGAEVREPHNDIIGILARGGLIALFSFLWFQAILLFRSFRLLDETGNQSPYASFIVGLVFLILCTLLNVVGESPFVMTFYALPYYFVAGMLLRMFSMRKDVSGST